MAEISTENIETSDLNSTTTTPAETSESTSISTQSSTTTSNSEDSTSESTSTSSGTLPSSTTESLSTSTSTSDTSATETVGETHSTGSEEDASSEESGEDADHPPLGSLPTPMCDDLKDGYAEILSELERSEPSLIAMREIYLGSGNRPTALQSFIRAEGANLGRVEEGVLVDDAAIHEWLTVEEPVELDRVIGQIEFVVSQSIKSRLRSLVSAEIEAIQDPIIGLTQWDEIYCLFNSVFRAYAIEVDNMEIDEESTELEMNRGFELGHTAIVERSESGAPNLWWLYEARLQIEKRLDLLATRILISRAKQANETKERRIAIRALGTFDQIRDRLRRRNSPGAVFIEENLLGSPELIDSVTIEYAICIAMAKHMRRRTSDIIEHDAFGFEDGYRSVLDGMLVGRICQKDLLSRLPWIDEAIWNSTWSILLQAARDGDSSSGIDASMDLTAMVCAYQQALGIRECTANEDEMVFPSEIPPEMET